MITLPLPSFADRPFPYLLWYLLVITVLSLWPFNFLQTNQVTWEADGGLKFTPPATAYTTTPPVKLAGLPEWTILMDAKAFPVWAQSRILGYSLDEHQYNLTLDQIVDDLVVRIRTGPNQRSRDLRVEGFLKPNTPRRFHLAVVYDGTNLSIYLDGERKAHERMGRIDYSAWGREFPLVFGSRTDGTFGWKGLFYRFAIIPQVLNPSAAGRTDDPSVQAQAVLSYEFNEQRDRTVIDHAAQNPVPLAWPERFIPYQRTILQSLRDYWPQFRHPYWGDIVANIIAYLPLGYLVSLLLRNRTHAVLAAALPVLCAVMLSLTVEVLQAYLPTRNSSLMDVITNGIGGCLGVVACHRKWAEKSLKGMRVSFRHSVVANNSSA